ncbi:hypothetical protein [Paenibacillus sp. N3/727]|uniref:hypothetical protein n=1 Tax=Paenibacillus sp. N3/727 TaxID=2925845 RepID=UPI0032204697
MAVLLTLPAFRKLSVREKGVKKSGGKEVYTVLLAIGTGLLLTGLGFIADWKGIAWRRKMRRRPEHSGWRSVHRTGS